MKISEAFDFQGEYDLWLVIFGLAALATAILPRLLSKYPISMPVVLLGLGAVALPLGLEVPGPLEEGEIIERLTELVVIISLMGAGLKIDRRFGRISWSSTWRLLGITMILSIAGVAFLGWWIAAFAPATAVLLGACLAPTDPVLATEVQVGSPGEGAVDREEHEKGSEAPQKEDEVRFSLSSEAGLNDGLAFPFTNMAIAMAVAGAAPSNWVDAWLLVDVLYKLGVGMIIGLGAGHVMARVILAMPATTELARAMIGLGALAATLLIYGATQYASGYGFIAVFVGAVVIRNYERSHHYQREMHKFTEMAERLLMAMVLIAFGAMISGGMLQPLDGQLVLIALLIIFLVRPLAGVIALTGFNRIPWRERLAIGFLGIRGIGSFYYLSYGLNHAPFEHAEAIWAVVGLVVLISIVVHGITATPIIHTLDRLRKKTAGDS